MYPREGIRTKAAVVYYRFHADGEYWADSDTGLAIAYTIFWIGSTKQVHKMLSNTKYPQNNK